MEPVRAVRRAQAADLKALYLTFDDGPDPEFTPVVLDLLARHGARACFFVIAERAERHPDLIARILRDGHTLGNHSLDHNFSRFFHRQAAMQTWIEDAETRLNSLSNGPSIGFRPPAGVLTPHLKRALSELAQPLILWNTRFYDSIWPWREAHALKSLARARSGDIVLLHDRQRPRNRARFIQTLDIYMKQARANGFELRALSAEDVRP